MNKTIQTGHLTSAPELRYTTNQTPVVSFGIACNRKWKNKAGEPIEEVSFFSCEMIGKRAETISKYFGKGGGILVYGRLKQDRWDAQDGSKRSKVKIMVEDWEFFGKSGKEQPQGSSQPPQDHSGDVPF